MGIHYATFNIEKIKSMDRLGSVNRHNSRINGALKNDDPSKMHLNEDDGIDARQVIESRLEDINEMRQSQGLTRLKKNTVPAIEIVMGASDDWFIGKSQDDIKEWKDANMNWAVNHYKGQGRLIKASFHQSETNPHLHLIFMPETLDKSGNVSVSAYKMMGNKGKMNRDKDSHALDMKKFKLKRVPNYFKLGEKEPKKGSSLKDLKRATVRAENEAKTADNRLSLIMSETLTWKNHKDNLVNFCNRDVIKNHIQSYNWDYSGWGEFKRQGDAFFKNQKQVLDMIQGNHIANNQVKKPRLESSPLDGGRKPRPK